MKTYRKESRHWIQLYRARFSSMGSIFKTEILVKSQSTQQRIKWSILGTTMKDRLQNSRMRSQTKGTIQPAEPFNGERAAAKLRKAMKGIGTDERVVIDILTNHTNDQRQEIKKRYKSMYGRDLTEDLRAELGGHFEDVCVALLKPPPDYLADCLYHAVSGSTPDEKAIIEMLCTRENWEIKEVNKFFRAKYDEHLGRFLSSDLSGDFQQVICALAVGDRDENTTPDTELAEFEAQRLFEGGLAQTWGSDADAFFPILCTRSRPQLHSTFTAYELVSGHCITEAIESEFSGPLREILMTVVHCLKDTSDFFAEQLHECMSGPITNDATLIRILVSRSEIDLEDIKRSYKKLYKKDLADVVAEDTSGDYRKILLRILRNN